MAEARIFLPSFFLAPEISLFWDNSIAITHSGTQKILPTPVGRKNSIGLSLLISLNDPDIPTFFHRSFPYIFFAPSSLSLSCFLEVLQNLGSDHLPILLSVPLSPVCRPNERPPSFNFQKACWNDFDSHCPFDKEYWSFFSFCCCSLYFSDTECGQIFHSFWPHQTPS